jgi:hypothetical protein
VGLIRDRIKSTELGPVWRLLGADGDVRDPVRLFVEVTMSRDRMISAQGGRQIYARPLREAWSAALSAFQAAPRKTIIAENSIHTIKPIAAASPP